MTNYEDLTNLPVEEWILLSELVHDECASIASNVCNAGEQLDFLLGNGYTLQGLAEWLAEANA